MAKITSGEWRSGDQIPSESALTKEFGVSRMTVHHALRDLTARGFLVRRNGAGTYVAEPSAYVTEYSHLDIIDDITQRGSIHRAEVLTRQLRPMTAVEQKQFEAIDGAEVFHAIILHREDEQPLELENRLIAPQFLPDAMAIDLASQTLFAHLMRVRPYREGSESVRAIIGSTEERQLLGVNGQEPCLEVTRRTWSPEGVVTLARMLRPGNRASMIGRIKRAGMG